MGFFSWNTSDTDRSIANQYSDRETFTVHMITEDGQVFTEENYDGYGVFGGKDIYELIADMNDLCPKGGDTDTKRMAAIDLLFKTAITNGEITFVQGKNFIRWDDRLVGQDGKTPNILVQEGWKTVYPNGYGDFDVAAKNGIKLPKLVEEIPEDFKDVPYPTSCEFQGYFYYDDEDEEDEEDDDDY